MTDDRIQLRDKTASDYCFLNGRADARLSDVERLTILGGAGLDRAVSRLSQGLSKISFADFSPDLNFEHLLEQRDDLHDLRNSGILKALLAPPDVFIKPTEVEVHGFPQGRVSDLFFDSRFTQTHLQSSVRLKDAVNSYSSYKENQSAAVRLWSHYDLQLNRKTIVAVHGWTMGDQRVNSLAFLPGLFFSLGYDVALIELPFHGRRSPIHRDGAAPLFPSPDPVRTFLSVANAIYDLRQLNYYLQSSTSRQVTCVGLSLGGYVAQLWASLDKLNKAVLLVPLVSMGKFAWNLLNAPHVPTLPAECASEEFFTDLYVDHCALTLEPATLEEDILVFAGRGDQVLSKSQIDLLKRHWKKSTFIWLHGGHAAHLRRGESFGLMREFIEK